MPDAVDEEMRKIAARILAMVAVCLMAFLLLLAAALVARAAECGPKAGAVWGAAPSFTQATRQGCWEGGKHVTGVGTVHTRHGKKGHRRRAAATDKKAAAPRPAFVNPRTLGAVDPAKTQNAGVLSIWLNRCLDEVEARDKEGSRNVVHDKAGIGVVRPTGITPANEQLAQRR